MCLEVRVSPKSLGFSDTVSPMGQSTLQFSHPDPSKVLGRWANRNLGPCQCSVGVVCSMIIWLKLSQIRCQLKGKCF